MPTTKSQIYLAGPLFTQAERLWNQTLAEKLTESGFEVFLPQVETKPALIKDPPDFDQVFEICLNGIRSAGVVVAILDGADADSGTCFECGYAYAHNIPVIGVRTDLRASEDNGLNAMLNRSCRKVLRLDPAAPEANSCKSLAQTLQNEIHTLQHT